MLLDATLMARKIVDKLSDMKGVDTLLLDMHDVSLLADYFIISTGEVERHIQAMADEVTGALKTVGASPFHTEGDAGSGWVLLDYGDVVVHLMSPKMRAYYRLEEFWKDARVVVRLQ